MRRAYEPTRASRTSGFRSHAQEPDRARRPRRLPRDEPRTSAASSCTSSHGPITAGSRSATSPRPASTGRSRGRRRPWADRGREHGGLGPRRSRCARGGCDGRSPPPSHPAVLGSASSDPLRHATVLAEREACLECVAIDEPAQRGGAVRVHPRRSRHARARAAPHRRTPCTTRPGTAPPLPAGRRPPSVERCASTVCNRSPSRVYRQATRRVAPGPPAGVGPRRAVGRGHRAQHTDAARDHEAGRRPPGQQG